MTSWRRGSGALKGQPKNVYMGVPERRVFPGSDVMEGRSRGTEGVAAGEALKGSQRGGVRESESATAGHTQDVASGDRKSVV